MFRVILSCTGSLRLAGSIYNPSQKTKETNKKPSFLVNQDVLQSGGELSNAALPWKSQVPVIKT